MVLQSDTAFDGAGGASVVVQELKASYFDYSLQNVAWGYDESMVAVEGIIRSPKTSLMAC